MGVKTYFKSVASAILAPVAKSLYNFYPNLGWSALFTDKFEVAITGRSAYNNKIFYSAARILVRKMIEAPITFNRAKPKQNIKLSKFYSKSIHNIQREAIKQSGFDELDNHELNKLFDGNNDYTAMDIREDFWSNLIFGDAYLFFEPPTTNTSLSRNRKPIAVHSVAPKRITPVRSNDRYNTIDHYLFITNNGEQIEVPKEYMLHMHNWNPNVDDLRGLGIDIIASTDIAINNAAMLAEGAAMENGGRGTLFSSDAELSSQTGKMVDKMTGQQMAALKKTITEDMEGARNNRRLKFTNGSVTVTPYGDTLAELEINKSEETRWRNIFAIMGLPWALSPVASQSSENSIKLGYKALVTNLVISDLKRFDEKLNQKIKKWWPDVIAITDITEYTELAPDLELFAKVYGQPILSEDERRKIFGFDELPNGLGKNILVQSGLIRLEDVVNEDPFNEIEDGNDNL